VAAALVVSSAAVSFAQGEMAVMQGTITEDKAGTPLGEATIKLTDQARGRQFTIKADKKGSYYKRGLPYGEYQMVVEKEGYVALNDKVRLAAGAEHRFDFKLGKAAPEGAKEFAEGFAAFGRGDNEAAVKFFEAAVQKAPELPEVHVNLALAYLRVGRKTEGVAALEKAATLSPDEPRTQFQLGGAYVEMTEYDKAIAAFEKGLAKQPDLSNTLAYEATVGLGAVYFAKGEAAKSIEQFEKALAARPGLPIPTLGLAKAHLSNGDTDKALALFRQVVASSPGTPEAAQADIFVKELEKTKTPAS
jgi:tetratricopeptide (TPR) repeat protein